MAALPPITSVLVPILSGVENLLAPLLSAYLPALDMVRQFINIVIPMVLGVHAIDSARLALTWFSGNKFGSFEPFSTVLQQVASALPNQVGLRQDSPILKSVLDPGFSSTLGFATNLLNSIDSSSQLYG